MEITVAEKSRLQCGDYWEASKQLFAKSMTRDQRVYFAVAHIIGIPFLSCWLFTGMNVFVILPVLIGFGFNYFLMVMYLLLFKAKEIVFNRRIEEEKKIILILDEDKIVYPSKSGELRQVLYEDAVLEELKNVFIIEQFFIIKKETKNGDVLEDLISKGILVKR